MKPVIAMMVVGHRDYQNHVGEFMAEQSAEQLTGVKVRLFRDTATDPEEARRIARSLLREYPDGVILYVGTWIEAPTAWAAIQEFRHLPFAIWGFPMVDGPAGRDSTGSLVGLIVLKAALDRVGQAYEWLLGLPNHSSTSRQAIAFARAAAAVARLRRTRLGLIGYASMGMYSGTVDHLLLRDHIGPEIVHIDNYDLIHLADGYSSDDLVDSLADLQKAAVIGTDVAPDIVEKGARLYKALRGLVRRHNLDVVSLKCQYELSQTYGCTGCVPLSLLAESGVTAGCEGDVLTSVSQALCHYITGQVSYYGDVIDIRDNEICLSSCGFAPFSLADPSCPAVVRPFTHSGFEGMLSSTVLKGGKVTFLRIAEKTSGFKLVTGTGEASPTQLRQGIFPALIVKLNGDPRRFMNTLTSQHYAIAYGDITPELTSVATHLGIELVAV